MRRKEENDSKIEISSIPILFTKGRVHTHTHTHTKLYSIIRNIIVTDSRQKLTICDRLSNEKLSPYLSTIFTLYILFPSLDLSKQKFKSKLRGEEETSSTTAIKNVGLGGQGR